MDKFSITAILIVILIGVTTFIFVLSYEEPATNYKYQNCYESVSETNVLKNTQIIASSSSNLFVCGIRERNAMPNVYQCYAMKYGCSK